MADATAHSALYFGFPSSHLEQANSPMCNEMGWWETVQGVEGLELLWAAGSANSSPELAHKGTADIISVEGTMLLMLLKHLTHLIYSEAAGRQALLWVQPHSVQFLPAVAAATWGTCLAWCAACARLPCISEPRVWAESLPCMAPSWRPCCLAFVADAGLVLSPRSRADVTLKPLLQDYTCTFRRASCLVSMWSGMEGGRLLLVSLVDAASACWAGGSLEDKGISRSIAGCRFLCLFYQIVAVLGCNL